VILGLFCGLWAGKAVPQSLQPFAVPWLWIAFSGHAGDYVLPGAAQDGEHIRMGRSRIVIKGFDPPITLAAHLARGAQDDPRCFRAATGGLDRSYEAEPAFAVAQPALAPLVLDGEQPLHSSEPGEHWIVRKL
jgi:hypothetical protein